MRLPRFQFRLRTLFVVMTIAAVGCAWFSPRLAAKRRERAAVETLNINGWSVTYDYQLAANGEYDPTLLPPGPAWLRKVLEDDFFSHPTSLFSEIADDSDLTDVEEALRQVPTVKSISMCGSAGITDKGLAIVTELTELESLEFLAASGATDASIPRLKRLTKLKWLCLESRHVSERSLRELKLALPDCKIADLGDEKPSR